jgi:DNA-binding MarR family transcriptional regulator
MENIEESIAFLIAKAEQKINRRARDKLSRYGVTPIQYATLKVLWRDDGPSGTALATRLKVDNATMTGVIDRLEAGGYVTRKPDKSDRRVQRIHVTPKARSLRRPLDAEMEKLNREVATELGRRMPVLRSSLKDLAGLGET